MRAAKPEAHVRRSDDGDGGAARRREQVLFELAKRNKADVAETFRAITEATAVALDVERTSIWRLLPDGTAIVGWPDREIDPSEPVPDDAAELLPDAPEPLPPAPIESTPDDPGGDPGGVPEPA